MIPKFKVGDVVSYLSGVGRATSIFEIEEIRMSKLGVTYSARSELTWHDEDVLTLYKGPLPKVKVYLYAFVLNGDVAPSGRFYKNDEDFKKMYPTVTEFQRLDWSETEIEA